MNKYDTIKFFFTFCNKKINVDLLQETIDISDIQTNVEILSGGMFAWQSLSEQKAINEIRRRVTDIFEGRNVVENIIYIFANDVQNPLEKTSNDNKIVSSAQLIKNKIFTNEDLLKQNLKIIYDALHLTTKQDPISNYAFKIAQIRSLNVQKFLDEIRGKREILPGQGGGGGGGNDVDGDIIVVEETATPSPVLETQSRRRRILPRQGGGEGDVRVVPEETATPSSSLALFPAGSTQRSQIERSIEVISELEQRLQVMEERALKAERNYSFAELSMQQFIENLGLVGTGGREPALEGQQDTGSGSGNSQENSGSESGNSGSELLEGQETALLEREAALAEREAALAEREAALASSTDTVLQRTQRLEEERAAFNSFQQRELQRLRGSLVPAPLQDSARELELERENRNLNDTIIHLRKDLDILHEILNTIRKEMGQKVNSIIDRILKEGGEDASQQTTSDEGEESSSLPSEDGEQDASQFGDNLSAASSQRPRTPRPGSIAGSTASPSSSPRSASPSSRPRSAGPSSLSSIASAVNGEENEGGTDEYYLETVWELIARALRVKSEPVTREELETLKKLLQTLYNKDQGKTLRDFARALFPDQPEEAKNFFDHNPQNGLRFTSADSQRFALLQYYGKPYDYAEAPDNVFYYTQANNDD